MKKICVTFCSGNICNLYMGRRRGCPLRHHLGRLWRCQASESGLWMCHQWAWTISFFEMWQGVWGKEVMWTPWMNFSVPVPVGESQHYIPHYGKGNKSKNEFWEHHQDKHVLKNKGNSQQNWITSYRREKILPNDISDKRLVSNMYKELIKTHHPRNKESSQEMGRKH